MWTFPEDRPFNIHDKDGQWSGCTLVEEDADTITFDYWNDHAQQQMRAQLRKDDLRYISYALVPVRRLVPLGMTLGDHGHDPNR